MYFSGRAVRKEKERRNWDYSGLLKYSTHSNIDLISESFWTFLILSSFHRSDTDGAETITCSTNGYMQRERARF